MKRKVLTSIALAVAIFCGCSESSDRPMADAAAAGSAAPDAGTQAADMSAAPPDTASCFGELPVMKVLDTKRGIAVDPDWSCVDQAASSPQSDPQPLQFQLIALTPMYTQGVTVDFFLGASTLHAPYATRMFDGASDHVSLDVPSGQPSLSIKVHALDRDDAMLSIPEVREYGLPIRSFSGPLQGFILLEAQRTLIVNLAERGMKDDDPEKAFLISYARDCSGHDLRGAQFELLDETGAAVASRSDAGLPHQTYMQFALPNPDCTFTGYQQAAWVMINAPVNANTTGITHTYRLRVNGRMHDSDVDPVVFGDAEVEMVAGAITYANLRPHLP
jgi:hypothetical protein